MSQLKRKKIEFRHILFSIFGVTLVGTLGFLLVKNMNESNAADMSGFWSGNIMSDEVMSNASSMNEAEIQNWLTSINPCNNYDRALYEEQSRLYPNVKWHFTDHFICISEERFGDGTVIGSGDSAAHIIWQAAQDYQINPQVLIVLLQKENGLITDTFPHSGQYKTATGYGCPDGAPCESSYFGLKNQIRLAAKLFRDVLNGGWSSYPAYQTNYIQYNPNTGCGGTNIYIENRATSALYRYTPYQPNAAALASDYGGGDACSAYGNRNFYSYFTDWFGDIHNVGAIGQATTLAEGTYHINSAINLNKSIDVAGISSENGANIQLWDSNNDGGQEWTITNAGDGYYYLTSAHSGKRLDLHNGYPNNGENIQLWEANDSCAQKWKPIQTPDNYITFESACSNSKTIDLDAGSTTNGTHIHLWNATNNLHQKWILKPIQTIDNGTYRFVSVLGNKSIDVAGISSDNGANIQLWDSNNDGGQEWAVVYDNNSGYYQITSAHSGKRLDLHNGYPNNGENIQLWEANDSCAQKWGIAEYNGQYSLISACLGNKNIDIAEAKIENGANIQLWTTHNDNNQKWSIIPIQDTLAEGTYHINSFINTNKSIDVAGISSENGANIQLWDSNNDGGQEWTITNAGDGYYYLTSAHSGKRLDLHNGYPNNGENIQLWEANDSCAQKWKPIHLAQNTYIIESACSNGKSIDVDSGRMLNATNIQLWSTYSNSNQKWIFQQ